MRRWIELPVLLAMLVIAAGLWAFVELIEVAREATPHAFDTQILLFFREAGDPDNPVGPVWMEQAVRDVTGMGSAVVLVFITAVVVIFLLIDRKPKAALFVLVAVSGGQLLSSLLKLGIDRPRPELVSHLAEVSTLSFPSGHAMLSAVTYLTLGSLIARVLPGRATRMFVLAVAVVATVMIGLSRIYLGVHWPSDVLAGWCAGLAWATLCWLGARLLLRRGREATAEGGQGDLTRTG